MLLRFLQLVGLNAIPIGGLVFGGWSPATALALYWCENVVGGALVAARIAMHRERTGKRGHYRRHLGLEMSGKLTVAGRAEPVDLAPKTLLAEFVWAVSAFTLAHGVFLWVFLVLIMKQMPDRGELRTGITAMVAVQLVGFAWDFRRLGERPFSWIKMLAERSLGRVVLVQLAILGGAFLSIGRPHPDHFFLVFAGLKLLTDLASWLPIELGPPDPERPPRFVLWLAARFPQRGGDFASYWRRNALTERRSSSDDEKS